MGGVVKVLHFLNIVMYYILRVEYFSRRRKTEKEKEENIWRRNMRFLEKKKNGEGKGGKYDREGNDGRVDRRMEGISIVL